MNEIADAYTNWSQTYETVVNPTRDLAATALRQQDLALSGKDALEIGCGTGLNTRFLAAHCRSVIGMDFSKGMLAQARVRIPDTHVRFLQSDIQIAWPVETASIDLVVCTLVLEHIGDLSHVFREARRVLRPGGEFLLFELHPFRQLQGGKAQFKDANSDATVYIPAFLHDVSEYVNTSLQAGFALVRLDEWRDEEGADKTAFPRLLSLHVRAPHTAD